MTRTHRVVFLGLAAVILVGAVLALGQGSDDTADDEQARATATATPTSASTPAADSAATPEATATPEPTPDPGPLLTAAKVTRIEAKQGDRVRFRARSDAADEIHVHGYDLSKEVEAGKPATMSFVADITGIFEIEFEEAGMPIAELRVAP